MQDSILPAHLVCASDQFGELERAGAFVYREFEPLDEPTTEYVEKLLSELGIHPRGKVVMRKYQRCLSDFLMAVRTTTTGKISWSGAATEYQDKPYGYDVAATVRDALIAGGHIVMVQKASKKDRLTRLYIINPEICPTHLRFKQHGEGPLVVVKSKKERIKGQLKGGVRMGRSQFLPELKELEQLVTKINAQMLSHPLCGTDGTEYVRCYRIFNNGSLKAGGRLYGRWQNKPEAERLAMTIDGEPVCEIDIKASFLSIAYAGTRSNQRLEDDPYQMIRFVAEAGNNKKTMRTVGKLLVNAYLCKEGELTQFPQGDRKNGQTVSFREKYGLKHNVQHYMDQIHDAFPFLNRVKQDGFGLMYTESEVMIQAMLSLMGIGVVAYPVHDCLLVKLVDKDVAVSALQAALKDHLDYIPNMDVSWLNDSGLVETVMIEQKHGLQSRDTTNNQDECESYALIDDDDFELFDDLPVKVDSYDSERLGI